MDYKKKYIKYKKKYISTKNIKNINSLFNLVIKYGIMTRKNEYDGLTNWNIIKKYLISDAKYEWSILIDIKGKNTNNLKEIYNYVHDKLGMRGDENDEKNDKWEPYHFFLQLIRIPLNNECSLQRIMQIAYNIGQYYAESDNEIYTEKIKNYFNKNKLGELHSYSKNIEINDAFLTKTYSMIKKEFKKISTFH